MSIFAKIHISNWAEVAEAFVTKSTLHNGFYEIKHNNNREKKGKKNFNMIKSNRRKFDKSDIFYGVFQ